MSAWRTGCSADGEERVNAGEGLDEATTNIAAPARAGIAPADIMRKTMVILLIIQPIVGARSRAEAHLQPGAEFRSSCGPQSGQFVVWLVTLLPVLSDVVVVRVLQGATGTGAGATTT